MLISSGQKQAGLYDSGDGTELIVRIKALVALILATVHEYGASQIALPYYSAQKVGACTRIGCKALFSLARQPKVEWQAFCKSWATHRIPQE
jgi:hypothetical protein